MRVLKIGLGIVVSARGALVLARSFASALRG